MTDNRRRHACRYAALGIEGKLVWNLRDIGHTLRSFSDGRGSRNRILTLLLETGKISQKELTELLGIQPGSASEVIAKLHKADLILRTPCEMDKRTADIELTELGNSEAHKIALERQKRHREMFKVLSREEKETFLSLSEKINSDWDRRYRNTERKKGQCGNT